MSEKKIDSRLDAFRERRDAADERKAFEDQELSALLDEWQTPRASRQLDERVMASYRRRIDEAAIGQTTSQIDKMARAGENSRANLAEVRQVSSEVLKMKQCPTCQETFADRFAFCPVDGTRLKTQVEAATPPAATPTAPVANQTQAQRQEAANGDAHTPVAASSPVAPPVVTTPPVTSAPSRPAQNSANANMRRAAQNADAGRQAPTSAEANGGNGAKSSSASSNIVTPPSAAKTPPVTSSAVRADANGDGATSAAASIGANGAGAIVPRDEYHLTILEDEGLSARLVAELREVAQASQLTWPEFKRAPHAFVGRMIRGYAQAFGRFLRTENVMPAIVTSFVVILTLVSAIFIWEHRCDTFLFLFKSRCESEALAENEVNLIDFRNTTIPEEQPKPTPDKGIGAADKAESRVGFNKGRGEGSKPQPEKAQGGGGGGMKEPTPAQQGALPPPSPIPAAIPKIPPTTMPKLPAGMDIDPALHKDLPFPVYGDPNSKSTIPSNGPGDRGGMGNGAGVGIGPGEGGGYGPGRGGNMGGGDKNIGGGGPGGSKGGNGIDYDKPFSASQVTKKAVITFKPEPGFTEEARKNNTTGIVRVRALLTSSGVVSNITALNRLPDGLTEKAIAAARQVKFIPAEKDGHKVSQWVTFEYNFNIY